MKSPLYSAERCNQRTGRVATKRDAALREHVRHGGTNARLAVGTVRAGASDNANLRRTVALSTSTKSESLLDQTQRLGDCLTVKIDDSLCE